MLGKLLDRCLERVEPYWYSYCSAQYCIEPWSRENSERALQPNRVAKRPAHISQAMECKNRFSAGEVASNG